MAKGKTAILIRCTEEEAETIRFCAKQEHRTISGFILNGIRHRIDTHRRLSRQLGLAWRGGITGDEVDQAANRRVDVAARAPSIQPETNANARSEKRAIKERP